MDFFVSVPIKNMAFSVNTVSQSHFNSLRPTFSLSNPLHLIPILDVEITKPSLSPISTGISSYLLYPLSPAAMNSDRFDLRIRFQTADMDQIALLAYVGQNGRHDFRSQHLALTFVKGYIMLTWNMGNGKILLMIYQTYFGF